MSTRSTMLLIGNLLLCITLVYSSGLKGVAGVVLGLRNSYDDPRNTQQSGLKENKNYIWHGQDFTDFSGQDVGDSIYDKADGVDLIERRAFLPISGPDIEQRGIVIRKRNNVRTVRECLQTYQFINDLRKRCVIKALQMMIETEKKK